MKMYIKPFPSMQARNSWNRLVLRTAAQSEHNEGTAPTEQTQWHQPGGNWYLQPLGPKTNERNEELSPSLLFCSANPALRLAAMLADYQHCRRISDVAQVAWARRRHSSLKLGPLQALRRQRSQLKGAATRYASAYTAGLSTGRSLAA